MRRDTRFQTPTGTRRRTAAEVDGILAAYRQSGLTQRVFARQAGFGVSTLQYWLRQRQSGCRAKFGKPSPGVKPPGISLLEVELANSAPELRTSAALYEIELPDGIRLRLAGGFVDGEVRRLLNLLREGLR